MTDLSALFPYPRQLSFLAGYWTLPEKGFVAFEGDRQLTGAARRRLIKFLGEGWRPFGDRSGVPSMRFCLLPPDDDVKEQSYRIRIFPTGVVAEAYDPAGLFYAAVTLIQIICLAQGNNIPCCEIEDAPDFPVRGVMLDISRDKVPTVPSLCYLIDRLADLKFNHLQLYVEHAFAYRNYQRVWQHATPFTAKEIRFVDAYCEKRCIELAPNQNSFGHMERWLSHPQYIHLAELPQGGAPLPWGGTQEFPSALCPTDPATFDFLAELYDEYLPNFTNSCLFNVGCDETFDLRGGGRSREQIEARGEGRVYLDHILRLHKMVTERGFRMAFWGDIIISHPELVPEIPKDALVLEWGYEADHPFDAHGKQFAAAGIPFCVCPGTSSWNSLAGRTDNMLANLTSAAENGLKHGACGYIVCDWGDWGHWHPLALSFPGFICAAGLSWCLEANRNAPWAKAADLHLTEGIGQTLFELGEAYRLCGATRSNSTELFHILSKPLTRPIAPEVTPETLGQVLARVDELAATLPNSGPGGNSFLMQEARQVIRLMRVACHKGIAMLDGSITQPDVRLALQKEIDAVDGCHRHIWLARNRNGGLAESQKRFTRIRHELT